MRISFFEEFPKKRNLEKLKLLGFKTDIYVASRSITEFKVLRRKIKKNYKNVNEVVYWPILSVNEGYWLSPFSKKNALTRIINELINEKEKLRVLWDAELPILNKKLFFTQIFSFIKNKILIKNFLYKTNHTVEIAEYGYDDYLTELIYRFLGIAFNPKKIHHKRIVMVYTSFIKNKSIEDYLLRHLRYNLKHNKKIIVALGTISKGIYGNEPVLNPKKLEHDLKLLQSEEIREVVVYSLDGLNKEYAKILREFI